MTSIDLSDLVKDFASRYAWHLESQATKPRDEGEGINSGLCDIFAEEVKALFPQAKFCYDEDIDHVYLKIDGRYYDAESPKGAATRKRMLNYRRSLVGQ
jgi:hypothetical protein